MKGFVRWPFWPAPAARAATRPVKTIKTNRPSVNRTNEITLALLEERPYSAENAKGYDPYNAGGSGRPLDLWRRKPKRD
jgi:hypothetical protein